MYNGMVPRLNSTVIQMLRTYQKNWNIHLKIHSIITVCLYYTLYYLEEIPKKFTHFGNKRYQIKKKKDEHGLVYAAVEESNLKSNVRVLHRNHPLSCEQFPLFTNRKSYKKQQQQQQHQ